MLDKVLVKIFLFLYSILFDLIHLRFSLLHILDSQCKCWLSSNIKDHEVKNSTKECEILAIQIKLNLIRQISVNIVSASFEYCIIYCEAVFIS